ncbi:Sirohydrochlorin cobaltochelatase [Slackia heliotrinireducens]|uniref:Cobalamin biosynthesis protein CbiK, Co2+ chelatase n=1 Tax=Slackia heliotrinireducens (strain ATCC 29202 / DSM 20476 / NCTC 11029 / RHS 1) TaxID=471855 RepID=C7N215_SLAHD|nr:sirohydrochlorin cobaltochelatase [Slackia heliotrinireducens]ACV23456.1 cobalamin biosynthesis protein CbiK, Co2+ chelatase [Slackia heliotrinireducens DSM 20476]VEH02778.1 Sirohydrochlorin cobaltochelatase [Slackia heliotrinireducens]
MKSFVKYFAATAIAALLAMACVGCASEETPATDDAATTSEQEAPAATSEPAATTEEAATTEVTPEDVDELIAAIQVQEWTETTADDCAAAKAAWDALSDDQKAQVEEGDYFALDTGDASADDPLNQDGIGENEILVVSFGTSFNDSRVADIGGVERAIQAAFPDWSVRRAFTAQIILNHIMARDGEAIDNVDQALQRAADNGVKNLVIQPTHLMHGAEYDELVEATEAYADQMNIVIAEPLLGEVGADATVINDDKKAVAEAVVAEAVAQAGYASVEEMDADGAALVLMGHGTSHEANVTYSQMQTTMDELGYKNVFIGTVEGEPEETECSVVIGEVEKGGYSTVWLRPMMVVAGDHANNDMADPEDPESWVSMFTDAGSFENIETQVMGLGEIPAVQELYVAHTAAALESIEG